MAQSVQIKDVNDWHENLIDYIIAHPHATLRMKAMVFGVTISWVSIVENSDSFKEKMRARRNEHFSNLSVGLVGKLTAQADMVTEEINKRLENDAGASMPMGNLLEIQGNALKFLGFGGNPGRPSQSASSIVNNNTIIVEDREALREAREAMAFARKQRPSAIEGEIIENDDAPKKLPE